MTRSLQPPGGLEGSAGCLHRDVYVVGVARRHLGELLPSHFRDSRSAPRLMTQDFCLAPGLMTLLKRTLATVTLRTSLTTHSIVSLLTESTHCPSMNSPVLTVMVPLKRAVSNWCVKVLDMASKDKEEEDEKLDEPTLWFYICLTTASYKLDKQRQRGSRPSFQAAQG